MSHYLKIALDCIFGENNFRNEITWYYTNKIPDKRKKIFTKSNDTILFYSRNDGYTFNMQEEKRDKPIKVSKIKKVNGKKIYVRGDDGKVIQIVRDKRVVDSVWKIPLLHSQKEYLGYPTQKPLALLKRIINASSDKDDVVLDPFCGCATTCIAAELLGRKWIGIDVSADAYKLVEKRLKEEVPPDMFIDESNFETRPPTRDKDVKMQEIQGYVYVISNESWQGKFKVGIAKDPERRRKSFQTSHPDRSFKLEHAEPTPHYKEIEKHIHKEFNGDHEWVEGDLNTIIKAIEDQAKQY